ncbi:MAG: HAMP domain-containing protein [Gemmatimonadales bacterium]|nr:HAMP domain-containing protein [Gemmatimonadales bacterium]
MAAPHPPEPVARIPIGLKLPLVAGMLVLAVALIMGFAAIVAVRQTLLSTSVGRQQQVAKLFAEVYGGAARIYTNQARTTADRPAVIRYASQPDPADRYQAIDALEFITGTAQDSQVIAVELLGSAGQQLLATGPFSAELARLHDAGAVPIPVHADSGALGPFRVIDGRVIYPVVARVGDGEPAARVVIWRRIAGTPETRRRVADLIGTSGTILSGNADGSVWADQARPVDGPSLADGVHDSVVTYHRAGIEGSLLGYPLAIPGTPWVLMVEFPRQTVLAPTAAFARDLTAIGLVGVALSLLVAWLLSGRLARPLRRLTAAAEVITRGGEPDRVLLRRSDELGVLGAAFDTMASGVRDSRQRLEEEVDARTTALNTTLTQLRDAQETLVRREKLATIGQLASSVGHELRNPLGVISNAAYYLELVVPDPQPVVVEYLGIIRKQVETSTKIINDLLDFSRVARADRHPLSLHSVVDAQLRELSVPPGITVEHDVPDTLPAVLADPVHVGQVMLNLVTNAVQAVGPAGGTVWLSATANGDGMARIEVRDSGPGVDPAMHDKIFEPLFTTKARGIGLGLAVSRSLVVANGGTLTSEPAECGGRFVLTLPMADRSP